MKNLKTMLSSEDMTWETPQDFFDELNKEFNFSLDPCATPETAKCKKFYTKEDDGLAQDWGGEALVKPKNMLRFIREEENCFKEIFFLSIP